MHHKSQFVITMVFAVAAIALIIHVPGSDAHKHKFHWKDWGKKKTYDTALKKTGRAFKDAFSAKRAERNAQKIQSGFKTLKKDINRDIIQPALKLTGDFVDCVGFGGDKGKGSDFTKCLGNLDSCLKNPKDCMICVFGEEGDKCCADGAVESLSKSYDLHLTASQNKKGSWDYEKSKKKHHKKKGSGSDSLTKKVKIDAEWDTKLTTGVYLKFNPFSFKTETKVSVTLENSVSIDLHANIDRQWTHRESRGPPEMLLDRIFMLYGFPVQVSIQYQPYVWLYMSAGAEAQTAFTLHSKFSAALRLSVDPTHGVVGIHWEQGSQGDPKFHKKRASAGAYSKFTARMGPRFTIMVDGVPFHLDLGASMFLTFDPSPSEQSLAQSISMAVRAETTTEIPDMQGYADLGCKYAIKGAAAESRTIKMAACALDVVGGTKAIEKLCESTVGYAAKVSDKRTFKGKRTIKMAAGGKWVNIGGKHKLWNTDLDCFMKDFMDQDPVVVQGRVL